MIAAQPISMAHRAQLRQVRTLPVARPGRPVLCPPPCARRKKTEAPPEEDVNRVVDEASASAGGFFNDSFKAVLQEAISRQGSQSLLEGQARASEDRISGQEEVLRTAIMASKANLMKLQLILAETEKAIEVETKQVERLVFALEKARNDAAYYRSLQSMLNEGSSSE